MEVGILGPLSVADGARSIEIGGARLRALLIRLASSAGGWVNVSELVEVLWESDPPGDEVNALQSLVSRLRRALPRAELIESGPAGYRLAIDPDAVDAIKFERLVARGRRELTAGHPEQAASLLGQAIGLWRGTPLVEVARVPYALTWAQRLEKRRLTAIDSRAAAGLQLGRHAELIGELEEIAEQNPLHERSHELLIRALAGSGRQAEALAVYERLSRRLASELGLDPPVHLQRLQTAVLRSDADELLAADRLGPSSMAAPVPPVLRPRPTNLRSPLTSFVGRGSEIAQLLTLIQLRSRLITLVGTGGAGKTRLASEAMTTRPELGPDGVWMVELAPVTDPDAVASTVLGSLGHLDLQVLDRPTPTHRDALSRLVEVLADHDVFVILDNCEHVLDAAATLAEYLLGQCPRLKILATSREPLGIVGESLCPVQPLIVPEVGAGPGGSDTPAVQLFIDRAALVRPGFALTEANAPAVVEICRRLDGLPLAIELAAARLRNLPVEAVAARLSNRFRLLTGGNRTAMPRHQTLRAVVAWSWELLSESERVLAARMSVFPGGVIAEAAEVICVLGDPEIDGAVEPDTVADLLMSLADKSLLVVVEPADGDNSAQPRYRMLETIHEFAGEQLDQRGETATLRAALSRYFLELAETAEPRLRSAEQLVWMDRLTAERDNLLVTLRYAAEIEDAETAVRLGAALSWYWTLLGRHDEATNWLGQALKIPGDRPIGAHAIALVVHALSATASGLGTPQPEDIEQIREMVNGLELHDFHPMLALVEPGLAMITDDRERAEICLELNLAHPDPWAQAMLNLMSGVQAENDGDIPTLEARLPLALAQFRKIGDRWGIGTALGTLSNLYTAQGRVEAAIEALKEARLMMTQLHASDDESYALLRIGMLRLRLDDVTGARADVETSLEISERTGSIMSGSFGVFSLAALAYQEGQTAEARRLALMALDQIDRAPFAPPQLKAAVYCGLSTYDVSDGKLDNASQWLVKAHDAILTSRDMPIAGGLATAAAGLLLARGDAARAVELLGVGIQLRGMDDLSDPEIRRVTVATQALMGPGEYARHHQIGQNLTRENALALIKRSL